MDENWIICSKVMLKYIEKTIEHNYIIFFVKCLLKNHNQVIITKVFSRLAIFCHINIAEKQEIYFKL